MQHSLIFALVISGDPAVPAMICKALEQPGEVYAGAVCVPSLAAAILRLGDGEIDIILLDPTLPDSQGIDSFDEVYLAARGIPILMLTSRNDEYIARLAIHRGAKDRVLKEHIDLLLPPALWHCLEPSATAETSLGDPDGTYGMFDSTDAP